MFVPIFMLCFVAFWAFVHFFNWVGKRAIKDIVKNETEMRDALIEKQRQQLTVRDETIAFLRKMRNEEKTPEQKAIERDYEYFQKRLKHYKMN